MNAAHAGADTLLISDDFFGYAREIKRTLEARGHSVIWFPDRYAVSAAAKATLRVAPWLAHAKTRAHFDSMINSIKHLPIRDVLVIKGESLNLDAIAKLRSALPRSRFTLYFWDSYRNMPSSSRTKVSMFDRALSFDPVDCSADPRLVYRPLFFLDDYGTLKSNRPDIDVLFVGTAHTDRYAVLSRLEQVLPRNLLIKKVLYLPSRALFQAKRVANPSLWRARESEFVFRSLPKADVLSLVARSRIVVDIERTIQAGLTMRTFEMLGAAKKLITTNPGASDAEFYHPSNVCVIDRKSPRVDASFLASPFHPVPAATLQRYSLSGWLDEVLP
jgi:hypothetical protein